MRRALWMWLERIRLAYGEDAYCVAVAILAGVAMCAGMLTAAALHVVAGVV